MFTNIITQQLYFNIIVNVSIIIIIIVLIYISIITNTNIYFHLEFIGKVYVFVSVVNSLFKLFAHNLNKCACLLHYDEFISSLYIF